MALIAGSATHPVGVILTVTMVVAIFTVHIDNGLFIVNNGYEFGLALFAASLSLVFSGAGKLALDNIIYKNLV